MTNNKNLNANNVESSAADNSAALDENGKNLKNNKNSEKASAEKTAKTASAAKTANAANTANAAENNKGLAAKKGDDKSKNGVIIAYSVNAGVGAALFFLIGYLQGLFKGLSGSALYMCLSDSFFVSGFMLAGFGILFKIAAGGFLDGIGYGLKRMALSLIPGARVKKEETYAEYKDRKEKSRKHASITATLVVGGVFIALAGVFLILWNVGMSAQTAASCFLCR